MPHADKYKSSFSANVDTIFVSVLHVAAVCVNRLRTAMGQNMARSVRLIVAVWICLMAIQVELHPLARRYVLLKNSAERPRRQSAAANEAPKKTITLLRMWSSEPEEANKEEEEDYVDNDDLAKIERQQIQHLLEKGKYQLVEVRQDRAEVIPESEDEDENTDATNGDERTSQKRPWRKVKRILQRQLVKKPKRYLKKLLRKAGLKRQLRSQTLTLVPLELASVQEVSILMHEDMVPDRAAAKEPIDVEGVFLLKPTN